MKLDVKKELYVFPVYAGVIPGYQRRMSNHICVPRVCGGDPFAPFLEDPVLEVFPVYAGVILVALVINVLPFSVPRVCGGDPRQ